MKEKRLKDNIRSIIAMGSLLLGIVTLAGCGQNSDTDEGSKDLTNQSVPDEEVQEEESSLAGWEMSLREGNPEELMAEAFRGMSVIKDGEPCLAVSYEPRAYKNSFDCWAVSVPYQSMVTVDTEAMYAYFRILENVELAPADGVTREQAGIEEISDRIFVAYYSGQTKESGQAEPDRGMTFRFGKQDEAGNYYVEAGGKLWLADQAAVDQLFGINPYELLLKVVSVVNLDTVSKVTVTFGGHNYEMRADGDAFWWNDKEMDSADMYEVYTELMSIFIERELTREEREKIDAGDRELLMSVTFERNREDAPKIIQRYYAFDGTYASVQVNDTEFFLVSREALASVQEKLEDTEAAFGGNS